MGGFGEVICFLLFFLMLWISSSVGTLKVINFTQSLDHFSPFLRKATFQQRLLVNDDHWGGAKSGAPIFVYLGNLRYATVDPNKYGILSLGAVEFKAMLVNIEHRFYGDSIPLGSIDLAMADPKTRSCLSVEQAMKDVVTIIESLKSNYSAYNSRVIVVGIDYGGALATWLLLNYPDIAVGALASSTPLLYYGNYHPGYGYCSIVSRQYKEMDQICYERIRQSFTAIDDIASQPKGSEKLRKIFKTCRHVSAQKLKDDFAQIFSNLAYLDGPRNRYKKYVCDVMTAATNPLGGLVSILHEVPSNNGKCYQSEFIGDGSPFEPSSNVTTAWAWLRCTGLIHTTGCKYDTMLPSRSFNMSQFNHWCKERFRVDPIPFSPVTFLEHVNIVEAITEMGGNIIFSNGLKDPSSRGGILKNLSDTVHAIVATNGTFAWDMMRSINLDDPEWLKDGRNEEMKILRQWISKGSNPRTCKLLLCLILQIMWLLHMYLN